MKRPLAIAVAGLATIAVAAGLVTSAAFGGPGLRVANPAFEIHKVDEARFSPTAGDPVFVLIVGNDGREGLEGQRGDALHLVAVNPAAGAATILNIPRDTYRQFDGIGFVKINAAYDLGGPVAQARAVSQLVGVDIPFVVSIGFEGFMDLVDEMGGVDVDVPVPMADANSGAYFDAGPNHLLGGPALALSRNRNLANGDFDRTYNQGLIILAALGKLRSQGTSLANTVKWLAVLLRHGSFDGAGLTELYRLGQLALSIDPANVRNVTMPGYVATTAGGSSVLVSPEGESLFADLRDDGILQSH